jgi:hypothetical protein
VYEEEINQSKWKTFAFDYLDEACWCVVRVRALLIGTLSLAWWLRFDQCNFLIRLLWFFY